MELKLSDKGQSKQSMCGMLGTLIFVQICQARVVIMLQNVS